MLQLDAVDAFYEHNQVLFGTSMEVRQREVVALMGRNGMGKTTSIRSVLGLTPPRAGSVLVRGTDVTGWPVHRIARRGLALVPEGRGIFPTLTSYENLILAARPGPWTLDRVLSLFPRVRERLDHLGTEVSGGEQQMLSIARALMTNPALIILDGATEGLAPLVRQEIWRALRKLGEEGTAALIVDKDVRALLGLADRHLIMLKGRVVFSGTAEDWRARAEENLALLRV